jgi:outer membrane usher protein
MITLGRPLSQPIAGAGRVRRLALCAGISVALGGWSHAATAAASGAMEPVDPAEGSASFDEKFLFGAGDRHADLSRFEHRDAVPPGSYNVDIFVNNKWLTRRELRFAVPENETRALPCLDGELIGQWGLRTSVATDVVGRLTAGASCVDVATLIPDASLRFDMSTLRLDISLPQADINQYARGYVSPENWDEGVTAGLVNYNFNDYVTTNNGQTQSSAYLGLRGGLNVGSWHLRENSTVTWNSGTTNLPAKTHWQNLQTYVQRDIPDWQAQLTLGDSFTDGQVFDSVGVRGVQIATDDRMLPDSSRGYAPVVRGSADTNALVTVRQNGMQIYQATVSPGPFVISDLYPTGYGGDLDVTVTEADGRVRSFSVPYASVAQLLRPGLTRFNVAAGELRDSGLVHQPTVVLGTVQHGFSNSLTGYAGLEVSDGYGALVVGGALNTRLGAIAMDVTRSQASIPGQSSQSGQSYRLTYSKLLPETNTSLTVAAYRYASSGYLSLSDAALARDYAMRGLDAFTYVPPPIPMIDGVPITSALTPQQQAMINGGDINNIVPNQVALQRQRNRLTLTLNQSLGASGGSLYANVSAGDYWGRRGSDTQFQVGYNNSFHSIGYGLSANRLRYGNGRYDNEFLLSLNIPLGRSAHAPRVTFNTNYDQLSGTQQQAMATGTLGETDQFSYSATGSHAPTQGTSGSVNVGYRNPIALINGTYGKGPGYSQTSIGVSGAVVAHPGGITFGQSMGDTVGVVHASGAEGAELTGVPGSRIDSGGYALTPYLSPYAMNTVSLDPKGSSLDVQLDGTSAQVAPHAGAVVMFNFKTQRGRILVIRALLPNGEPLPFGADVIGDDGQAVGIVGQAGRVLVRLVKPSGRLTARWHDEQSREQSCHLDFSTPPQGKKGVERVFKEVEASCLEAGPVSDATRHVVTGGPVAVVTD